MISREISVVAKNATVQNYKLSRNIWKASNKYWEKDKDIDKILRSIFKVSKWHFGNISKGKKLHFRRYIAVPCTLKDEFFWSL